MSVYEFDSYKKYIDFWLKQQPKNGRGLYAKMAEEIGVSAVTISQVFNGEKNLSAEHTFALAEFLGLNAEEKNYLLLLVSYERAGSEKLRRHLKNEIKSTQKSKFENLKAIVKEDIVLSEADKAIFHSSWLYSAIRLMTSIDGYQSAEALANRFQVSREEILTKLNFLVEKKLCVQTKDGVRMGPQRTHLEADSPYIRSRQVSWRVKGFEKMERTLPSYLFYTGPMSISETAYTKVRKQLVELIASLGPTVAQEEPEKLVCLNIDFFDV